MKRVKVISAIESASFESNINLFLCELDQKGCPYELTFRASDKEHCAYVTYGDTGRTGERKLMCRDVCDYYTRNCKESNAYCLYYGRPIRFAGSVCEDFDKIVTVLHGGGMRA